MALTLPPLPKIEGDVDLILDVHTHDSLRPRDTPMNDDYGDTARLAELGAKVLDLVVTTQLFARRPCLTAEQIANLRAEIASDAVLDGWLTAYNLKAKLRYVPDTDISSPKEIRKYFNTFVGALYVRNGLTVVQNWIHRLIDPDTEMAEPEPNPPALQYNWSPPAPPSGPPPPLPSYPPPTLSSPTNTMSSLVSLALVNQTAAQRGFQVTYPAHQEGPPHLPVWTDGFKRVSKVNGEEKGRGSGKSQKLAKEEAARLAWAAMGW